MKYSESKERWINEVLGSTAGMQRIAGDSAMYEKVMNRMAAETNIQGNEVRWLGVKTVAAAAILLFIVNMASIYHYSHKVSNVQQNGIYQSVNEDISSLSEDNY